MNNIISVNIWKCIQWKTASWSRLAQMQPTGAPQTIISFYSVIFIMMVNSSFANQTLALSYLQLFGWMVQEDLVYIE